MDFYAKITALLTADGFESLLQPSSRDLFKTYLVSLQREAWNARGKADIEAISDRVAVLGQIGEPYVDQLHAAVKGKDL